MLRFETVNKSFYAVVFNKNITNILKYVVFWCKMPLFCELPPLRFSWSATTLKTSVLLRDQPHSPQLFLYPVQESVVFPAQHRGEGDQQRHSPNQSYHQSHSLHGSVLHVVDAGHCTVSETITDRFYLSCFQYVKGPQVYISLLQKQYYL